MEPPRITCPDDLETTTDTIDVEPRNVTDNVGVSALSRSPFPGSRFPNGTTTVTFTAVDFSGNSASCTFNVTVILGKSH